MTPALSHYLSSSSPWYPGAAASLSPHIAERALEWLVELQGGDATPELREQWLRWRGEHPDHERAWQRIEAVSGRLQPLASSVNSAIARAALLRPQSLPRRRAIKTLAALVFAGGAAWGIEENTPWREWTSDYRTGVGERRALVLPDGSRLVLNTGSAVDVRFGGEERRVRLVAGEIFITTAADRGAAPRPFLVETTHGTAQALGTVYSVRQQDGDTQISVFEGAVRIRPRGDSRHSVDVSAGYAARYTASATAPPQRADEAAAAWKDGFMVARSMRLDAFIAELGRYSRQALSCDPAIAGLQVSGSFPLQDIEQVLHTVSTTLGVKVEAQSRFWGGRALRLVAAPPAAKG